MSEPISLKNEGLLCIPEPRAFAAFARSWPRESLAKLESLPLERFTGTGAIRHEPFYTLVGPCSGPALRGAIHAALDRGALTAILLGPAQAVDPALPGGRLMIVEAALRAQGDAVSAPKGMVRKLANRLRNHGLEGQAARVAPLGRREAPVCDTMSLPLMAAMEERQLPRGALLVTDPSWPWQGEAGPDETLWGALYPVFAEILGRARHYPQEA